jgi:hypothetical protein
MSSHLGPSSVSESGKDDEASYHRKREQVWSAQRVRRDRRAAYISGLECEVRNLVPKLRI